MTGEDDGRSTSLLESGVSRDKENNDQGFEEDYDLHESTSDETDVYYVKQHKGYASIGFSIVQTIVLGLMMWQCGVAPLDVNPMVGPYPDALSYWGAKNSVLIIDDGEAWRLLTPILLHAGIIHLLCNVAVQLETGAFFEREWGSGKWLLIYLSSAVGSSCLSTIFMPGQISVGSSGSVCGLFGAKLSEVFCRICEARRTRQQRIGHDVRMEQLKGIMCSVVIIALFSFIPYVDWAAHLGGLLAGIVVGLMIFAHSIDNRCWVRIWFLVGTALTIIFYAVSLNHMYTDVDPPEEIRDVCEYYRSFFPDYECNCQLNNGDN
jgi:membrane associated rhomboid family serine protease